MIVFQKKLYLGAGNSSNEGPAKSPGAVPIITFDLLSDSFETNFRTSEDQVDAFFIIDGSLFVPGHDPKESWAFGNLYVSEDGQNWKKKRTIPQAIHTYSLQYYQEKLFAALGTGKGAVIATSEDMGDTWTLSPAYKYIGRFYNFLLVGGRLYVTGTILQVPHRQDLVERGGPYIEELFEYTEIAGFIHRVDISSEKLFPQTTFEPKRVLKIVRPQVFKDTTVYIGGYVHNDHQAIPFGVYAARSLKREKVDIRKIDLPAKVTPWDIYVSGDYLYILANKIADEVEETIVYRSQDLENWEEHFFFKPPGLIRSFAKSENSYYFSVGSEVAEPPVWMFSELDIDTGTLYRLKYDKTIGWKNASQK